MPHYVSPEVLTRTPVKEIIFSISFKENLSVDTLRKFIGSVDFQNESDVEEGFKATINRPFGSDKPQSNVALDHFIISDKTAGYTLQAKRGNFNFHKTNGYQRFEEIYQLVEKYWNDLQRIAGTLTPQTINLRYLNLIQNGEDLEDLVKIHTEHPYGNDVKHPFQSFLLEDDEQPELKITVVCTRAEIDGDRGLVLDIHANKSFDPERENLQDAFTTLRKVKNEIFFLTITEKTKAIYNHE